MRKDNRQADASLVFMIFVVLFVSNWQRCCAQIDSVICNLQDFNYLTAYTEANYAAYPSIIEHGHTANYQKLKENVKDSLMSGAWGIEQAVSEYAYWFSHYFDAHYYADLPYFWHVCKRRDIPDYSHIMDYHPKPVSKKIDKTTWLIRVPSCAGEFPTNAWFAESVNMFFSSKCKNLILDIRGNSGGNDAIWEPLLPLMVDHQARFPEQYFFRNTSHNRYHPEMPGWMKKQLENVKDGKPFEVWGDDDAGDVDIPPHDADIHIAIIIDRKTASAAETILRVARNYSDNKRVTLYGKENSAGCAATGNLLPFRLPHSRIQVFYPTTVSSAFLHLDSMQSASGIEPDVRIELPYPNQLTDNTDSWVLWVSKDMKKKRD
jgi:hypothetical protein